MLPARSGVEVAKVTGGFANALLLCSDLSGNPSFEQLLQRTDAALTGASAHQDYPLPTLLQQRADSSRSPLFDALFLWEPGTGGGRSPGRSASTLAPFLVGEEGPKVLLGSISKWRAWLWPSDAARTT